MIFPFVFWKFFFGGQGFDGERTKQGGHIFEKLNSMSFP